MENYSPDFSRANAQLALMAQPTNGGYFTFKSEKDIIAENLRNHRGLYYSDNRGAAEREAISLQNGGDGDQWTVAGFITPGMLKGADVDDLFGLRFRNMTGGLSPEEVIESYLRRTGEVITRDTLKTLFESPELSRNMLMKNENLHKTLRDILNEGVPRTLDIALKSGEWKEMGYPGNAYHGPEFGFRKFVSANGYREAVFDYNGNLITRNSSPHGKNGIIQGVGATYMGTFNFFPSERGFWGHYATDMQPYYKWGN